MDDRRHVSRRTIASVGGLGMVILLGGWLVGCGRTPQVGPDEDTFKAVDALFTAVTAHDEKLLGECEKNLHRLAEAGHLPGRARDHLDAIIQRAAGGHWQSAAEKLYHFMRAQRREGRQQQRAASEESGGQQFVVKQATLP